MWGLVLTCSKWPWLKWNPGRCSKDKSLVHGVPDPSVELLINKLLLYSSVSKSLQKKNVNNFKSLSPPKRTDRLRM